MPCHRSFVEKLHILRELKNAAIAELRHSGRPHEAEVAQLDVIRWFLDNPLCTWQGALRHFSAQQASTNNTVADIKLRYAVRIVDDSLDN